MSTFIESIGRDVLFAGRLVRKNPTPTVVAVLSLSLAMGACTAAFSLIDALILRPLPVREPNRLVNVVYRAEATGDSPWFNYPLFERMRRASQTRVQLFGMSVPSRWDAVFEDEPFYLPVAPGFFETMRIQLVKDGRSTGATSP
jgi:hypothetical protein